MYNDFQKVISDGLITCIANVTELSEMTY